MKKFFLMLAVALPMFFMASCGDDNDDDENFFHRDVEFSMPVLTKATDGTLQISNNKIVLEWGDDASDVKQAMNPFSYVYNTTVSTSKALVYNYDADLAYPWYIYALDTVDGLASSSITISLEQDDEVDFDKYLKDNGYKDVTTDDDDDFVYRSKDKLTIVHYGMDGEQDNVSVIWVPNVDNTRAAAARAAAYAHLELVKSVINQK